MIIIKCPTGFSNSFWTACSNRQIACDSRRSEILHSFSTYYKKICPDDDINNCYCQQYTDVYVLAEYCC